MTRVQVLLSEDQDRRLEELARANRQSKASLVRRAVDLLFRVESEGEDPLQQLIGQAGRSGHPRGASDHDRLLMVAERRRNRGR
jgi:hypothetical protein